MQVSLIDIGTSKGIRIPSSILKEMNKPQTFDLQVEEGKIILKIVDEPRKGWAEKFRQSDNPLLIDDTLDADEWNEI